jgi:hypothetical protein
MTDTDRERTAVIAGPDSDGLGDALAERGLSVARIDGLADRPALERAGIVDAELFVLTDVGQATAIPIARDLTDGEGVGENSALRVVVYASASLPAFAAGQADLLVDPALLDPEVVAEELVG